MIVIPFGFVAGASAPPSPAADLLLNDYPEALGAYSMRKLNKNYTGSAIEVRESGGGTLADIGFDANGDLDTAALLTHTGGGDGFVRTWYDQSFNNLDMAQATDTNQPQIVSAGAVLTLNGKPTINFDGNDNYLTVLSTPYNSLTSSVYLGVVALESSPGSYKAFFSAREGSLDDYISGLSIGIGSVLQTSFKYLNFETAGLTPAGAQDAMDIDIPFDTQTLVNCTLTPTATQVYFNGTAGIGRVGNGSSKSFENLQLGARWYSGQQPGQFIDADMQEVIIYPTATLRQRTSIETNIGQKYMGWDYSSFSTYFDGVADYVDCGNTNSFEYDDAFSISLWVKPEYTTTRTYIAKISNSPNTGQGYAIDTIAGAKIRFWIGNNYWGTKYMDVYGDTSVVGGTWYHVVCTYDGSGNRSGMKLYVNAVAETLTTGGAATLSDTIVSSAPLRIGINDTSNHMSGNIDEVAIFSSELTSGQTQTIYNDGLPADLTDLSPTTWWRMGDESGWPLLTNKMAYSKYSLEFDGVDDYVDCGQIDAFKGVTGFTISGWFKQTTLGVKGFMFGAYISNSNFISAETWNDNNMYFEIREGASSYAQFNTYASVVTAGEWFHMAMVFDGTEPIDNNRLKAYINGSPLSMSHSAAAIPTITLATQGDLILGNHTGYNNYWEGGIDEFAIFDTPFSPSQITTLYNGGTPNDISSLNPTNYYKVDGSVYPNIDNAMAYSKKSLLFDGVTDRVNMGNVLDQTGLAGSDFSISAWVKIEDITTFNYIFSKAKKSANYTGYHFYIRPTTGYLTFYVSGQNASEVTDRRTTTNGVVEGEWAHVVVTYTFSTDASGITFYTNGELTTSSVTSSDFTALDTATNSYDCLIGAREDTGLPMDGYIDDVSFFDSVLSLSDVQTIYNNGKPADISALSPLAWWKMGDDDFFPIIKDYGSGSNNGTMINQSSTDINLDTPMGYGVATNMVSGINNFSGGTANGNGGIMVNMSQEDIQHDVPKYSDKSVAFDGVADRVYLTDSGTVPTEFQDTGNNNAYSFFSWIKTTGGSGGGSYWFPDDTIIEIRTQEPTDVEVPFSFGVASNKLWLGRSSDSLVTDEAVAGVATVNDGNWHHVGFTVDDDAWVLYVDGESDASGTFSVATGDCSVGTQTSNLQFGCRSKDDGGYTNCFSGNIDEAAFWNSALTSDTVQTIYNSGVPTDISDLSPIGWWRMGEGSTYPTIVDAGSGSNNATMVSMTAASIEYDTP